MIPHRVTLQDIGPFTDLVDVDFDALAHGIVAIDGNNGTGKTVFVESIIAGTHRKLPSYGALADMATSRDAYLQLEFSTRGRRWKARHEIGKGKVFLYNDRNKVLDEKGSAAAFDEWVSENVLPLDVITASWCSPQESRGFIGMDRSPRKSIVLQAMGSAESERLAERARKRTKALERDLVEMSRNVDGERGRFIPVDEAEAALRERVDRQAKADETASAAAAALQDAISTNERWVTQLKEFRDRSALHNRALDRVVASRKRLNALDARIIDQQKLLANADVIRVRVVEHQEAQRHLLAAKSTYEETRLAGIAASDKADAAHRARTYVGTRLEDARRLLAELDEIIAGKDDAQKAADEALATAAQVDRLTSEIGEVEEEIRIAFALGEEMGTKRAERLRSGLGAVVHQAKTIAIARKTAETTLTADDETMAKVDAARLASLQEKRDNLRAHFKASSEQLSKLEQRSSMLTTILKNERNRDKVVASLATAVAERDQADADRLAAMESARSASQAHHAAGVALASAVEAERLLAPWAAEETRLGQAEGLAAEMADQRTTAVADLAEAIADQERLPDLGEAPQAPPLLDDLRRAHAAASAAAQEATRAVACAEEDLRRASESAERVAKLRAQEQAIGEDVRDTATLAEALGSSGIQALLVDAAGPELTQGMNELLHEAIGPRWTVSVETTQLDAKGKRELEAFNIMVTDTDAPPDRRTRESKLHCGGERVYIAEALATTLAGMSGRRFDLEGGTLIRDEASAALRGYNIHLWFDLLRLGMRANGMARTLVVTHHQEALDLADQVIEFVDGTVRVIR